MASLYNVSKSRRGGSLASREARSSNLAGWGFLAPFLAIYAALLLFPIFQAISMGFYDLDLLVISDRTWIGFDNYVRMFWGTEMAWTLENMADWRIAGLLLLVPIGLAIKAKRLGYVEGLAASFLVLAIFGVAMGYAPSADGRWFDSQFWLSFGNTVLFVLLSTPLIVGFGLLLALALNRPGRWTGVLRTLFFAPFVLSVSVLTLIWAFMLNPQLGLVGTLFESLGLEPISWLTSPFWAMPAVVIATLWWTVGFNIVLFLAGLQDIDKSLYEAAEIDGAGRWGRFRFITIPGLSRTTLLVTVLQVIASFQIFGQVYIMTRGGPNGATRVSIQHIYESGFRDLELGYASAMSVFLFLVMVFFSVVQFRMVRSRD
jgi:multiple sugar transport system permease protein